MIEERGIKEEKRRGGEEGREFFLGAKSCRFMRVK